MNDVWDRAADVLRGRARMLAAVAFFLSFLPQVAQAAVTAAFAVTSVAYYFTVGVVALAVALLAIWSNLAVVAAASDPSTDLRRALSIGAARLPTAIGLTLLFVLGMVALLMPVLVMVGASGIDVGALNHRVTPVDLAGTSPGAIVGAFLFLTVIVLPILIWVSARLAVFNPVLVNERLGLRTFARSWRLTHRLTWRIIGVFLLAAVLYAVVAGAAQLVIKLLFRLLLGTGGGGTAVFMGTLFTAAASAAFGVVTATFTAQLYRTLTGREAAETFA